MQQVLLLTWEQHLVPDGGSDVCCSFALSQHSGKDAAGHAFHHFALLQAGVIGEPPVTRSSRRIHAWQMAVREAAPEGNFACSLRMLPSITDLQHDQTLRNCVCCAAFAAGVSQLKTAPLGLKLAAMCGTAWLFSMSGALNTSHGFICNGGRLISRQASTLQQRMTALQR